MRDDSIAVMVDGPLHPDAPHMTLYHHLKVHNEKCLADTCRQINAAPAAVAQVCCADGDLCHALVAGDLFVIKRTG